MKNPTVYYLAGGETKVYHAHHKCAGLKTPWRHWHLMTTKKDIAEIKGLRPCKRCVSYE